METSNLPNFVIVGAMKAGTSNLRKILIQHPDVSMSNQEIGYFSNEESYAKGVEWYKAFFKDLPDTKWIGEKSPNYYFYPGAAKRIHELIPNAKLIFILRDPISRAYSDYWFSIYRGRELLSFKKAVALELKGKRKSIYRQYLKRSSYLEQIREYLEFFPPENILALSFKKMKANPQAAANECFDFLGLDTLEITQTEEAKNPTYLPMSFRLNYLASHLFMPWWPWMFFIIRRITRRRKSGYPKMDESVMKTLTEHFAPMNKSLKDEIGFDFES